MIKVNKNKGKSEIEIDINIFEKKEDKDTVSKTSKVNKEKHSSGYEEVDLDEGFSNLAVNIDTKKIIDFILIVGISAVMGVIVTMFSLLFFSMDDYLHDEKMISYFHNQFVKYDYSDVTDKSNLVTKIKSVGKVKLTKETLSKIDVIPGNGRYFIAYNIKDKGNCMKISRAGHNVKKLSSLDLVPENIHVPFCIKLKGSDNDNYQIAMALHTKK